MNSQPIASDLSYECLQLRRLRAERGLEPMDSTLARLKPIPGAYEDFFPTFGESDRPVIQHRYAVPKRSSVLGQRK